MDHVKNPILTYIAIIWKARAKVSQACPTMLDSSSKHTLPGIGHAQAHPVS